MLETDSNFNFKKILTKWAGKKQNYSKFQGRRVAKPVPQSTDYEHTIKALLQTRFHMKLDRFFDNACARILLVYFGQLAKQTREGL